MANQTLEQIPHVLYQGNKRKVRRKTMSSRPQANGIADTTDSDLDHSDSGYSSPMHRRNQISSGTDASRNTEQLQPYTTPTSITTCQADIITPKPESYTSAQTGSTSLYHAASIHNDHSNLGLIAQPPLSYATVLTTSHQNSSAKDKQSSAAAGKSSRSGSISAQNNGANVNDVMENAEFDDDDVGMTADDQVKKKRRRGRRRRKKG